MEKEYEELINISLRKRKKVAKDIRSSIIFFWIFLIIGGFLIVTLAEKSIWFVIFSILLIVIGICFGFYVGYTIAKVKNALIRKKSFSAIVGNSLDFWKVYPNYMNYLDGKLTEKQLLSKVNKLY
jgi:hypothetical protein